MPHPSPDREELKRLYREAIRQHAADPVGYRQSIAATHRHEEYNPLCGDRVELMFRVDGDRVEAAAFDGAACAICMASASLVCSLAPGRTTVGLRDLGEALQRELDGSVGARFARDRAQYPLLQENETHDTESKLPEALSPLLGVRPYPSRIRCATLPWTAAQRALAD